MIRKTLLIALITFASAARAQTTQPAADAADAAAPATMPTTASAEQARFSRVELYRRANAAIRSGVKFLISRQNSDGSWSGEETNNIDRANSPLVAGNTALVTLALLYSGESYQSPTLDRAIKFLKKAQPQKTRLATYTIALRAAVYASLPEPLRKQELAADLRWLEAAIVRQGGRRGMYDYGLGSWAGGDYSNSQYGVLGVWYAAQAGLEVPISYWKLVEEGWVNGQNDDGGWPYHMHDGKNSYASMSAAGAATLFITNDYVHAREYQDLQNTVSNKPLEAAMKWIAENFSPNSNVGMDEDAGGRFGRGRGQGRGDQPVSDLLANLGAPPGWAVNYMLFGYERVGEASGLTRFGDHKWFDEGAEYLIRNQGYDGSWLGDSFIKSTEINSAYALLFLSRGRAPVIIQKLQFPGRWNNRPRDAAAFTQFMRRATERHVNWQVVGLDASPEEFREAPMLYVASDRPIALATASILKTYIDQGGLLVCVNEGPDSALADSVVALAAKMYPAYRFRDLPADHLIYTANFPVDKDEKIRALSNGVRELIVLYPSGDMSWKWHSAGGSFQPKDSPYASLANLWLYVTDRSNPRYKGEDTWVDTNPAVVPTHSATVARIRHEGNWDPEPAGWQRLASIMHNFDQFDLKIESTTDPRDALLAHLTSTDSVRLLPAGKMALKQYLDSGGLLLMDAAGGSPEAAGSFEPLLRELYPTVTIAPLPLDHPIYHAAALGGTDIDQVNYRRSRDLTPVHIPKLRGATVNGKLIAIISDEDLSGGLVGYSTAGLTGYTPQSAVDLVRNIIFWRSPVTK